MSQLKRGLIGFFLLAGSFAWTIEHPAQAATPASQRPDSDRTRVSELFQKGEVAAAEKLLTELQAVAAVAAEAPGPGGPKSGSVFFEEIKDCGFYPQETRLECVIEIKQKAGYAGPVGSPGSVEHVYFCIDWTSSGTFTQFNSVGQGSVQMHDESAGAAPIWHYAVYRDINPLGGLRTSNGGNSATTVTNGPTRNARAILSWNTAPTGCNFSPVWGNVLNFQIRFDPIR